MKIQILAVYAAHAAGDVDDLAVTASGEAPPAGTPAGRAVTRGVALALLDRVDEARRRLDESQEVWAVDPTAAPYGELFAMMLDAWSGRPDRLARALGEPVKASDGWFDPGTVLARLLLTLGDARGARRVLGDLDDDAERLTLSGQAVLAVLEGRIDDGLELGRRCVAGAANRGDDAGVAVMHQNLVFALIGRGRLQVAQDHLAAARAAPTSSLGHLLVVPDAALARILGEHDAAVGALETMLAETVEREVLVGTELAWSQRAELALDADDPAGARRALAAVEDAADRLSTTRAAMYARLVRAQVLGERGARDEAVALCRERGQPGELGVVALALARYGSPDRELLREAYDVLGELDALLSRSWARTLMAAHDVPVPGRQATVAENERLLALLVSEGLTNRQLAGVLRTSEKSVEGRLSRLFTRAGYRSRIELVAALTSGEYVI